MQGGIGPAGLASEDLHVLDFTDFERPRWHRHACAPLLSCSFSSLMVSVTHG